jgi:hypothetical protein
MREPEEIEAIEEEKFLEAKSSGESVQRYSFGS